MLHIKRNRMALFGISMCLFAMVLNACNKNIDLDSFHAAAEEEQWKKIEDARAGLMGIYGLTRAALAENNGHWLNGDVRGGDFTVVKSARNEQELQNIVNNRLAKSSTMFQQLANWKRFYAVINAAAVFIERAPLIVENDRSYSETNLQLDIAQARALRAFTYFYMARMWGNVPLITKSFDNGSFKEFPQSDAQTVLTYAKSELLAVLPNLPFEFGSESSLYYGALPEVWRGMLFNKIWAYACLAHIAAWQGNYADVETYTKFILDNTTKIGATYTPIDKLVLATTSGFFNSELDAGLRGSKILAFNFVSMDNKAVETTQSGHLEQLTLAYPFVKKSTPDIYVSKDSLFSIFDDMNDLRFGIDTLTYNYTNNYIYNINAEFPIFSKIKIIQNGANPTGDYGVFGSALVFTRLEEIALLRAEALVALNRGEEAVPIYNTIRMTRGFTEKSYLKDFGEDDEKLLNAIFEERRKELMGEGWRWYDLIRRQKLLKDDPAFLQLIEKGGIYWPIASDVLNNNSLIQQNNYWK
ncbi:RagB/SusD family nutrient uptake outer membrane protein [Sphingobacterium siyangense]|uniref:RagB/SusD family nutrient uptake outer membrane protein n=1 Tax=Sphingobacterium siyangense TaxID=459529 RepID=UPI003C78410D